MNERDIWDRVGKLADSAIKGTAAFLELASQNASRNKNFTEDQRQEFREYSERMRDIKENGFQSLSSDDDYCDCNDEYDDDYDEEYVEEYVADYNNSVDYKDAEEFEDDYYDNSAADDNDEEYDNSEYNKQQAKKSIEERYSDYVEIKTFEKKRLEERKHEEKTKNRKILDSIKKEKEFLMRIQSIQYAEKRSGSGFILCGQINKGGYIKQNKCILLFLIKMELKANIVLFLYHVIHNIKNTTMRRKGSMLDYL